MDQLPGQLKPQAEGDKLFRCHQFEKALERYNKAWLALSLSRYIVWLNINGWQLSASSFYHHNRLHAFVYRSCLTPFVYFPSIATIYNKTKTE